MSEIHVYEPALCCTTGVCGPDLDPALVAFTADLGHVTAAGGRAERHNLANDPQAFATSDVVRGFLQVAGSAGLPLTVVDGVTALTGRYPTRAELRRWAGLDAASEGSDTSDSSDAPGADPAAEPDASQWPDAPEQPAPARGSRDLGLVATPAASGGCCGGDGCC